MIIIYISLFKQNTTDDDDDDDDDEYNAVEDSTPLCQYEPSSFGTVSLHKFTLINDIDRDVTLFKVSTVGYFERIYTIKVGFAATILDLDLSRFIIHSDGDYDRVVTVGKGSFQYQKAIVKISDIGVCKSWLTK